MMIQEKNYCVSSQSSLTYRRKKVWIFLPLLLFVVITLMSSISIVVIAGGIGIILIFIRNILVFFKNREERKMQEIPCNCKQRGLTCQSENYEDILLKDLSFNDRLKYHNFLHRLGLFNHTLKRENLTNEEFNLLLEDVFHHKLK